MDDQTASAADQALARLIVGYGLQASSEDAPSREAIAEYYRRLDATAFPAVAAVLPNIPEDLRTEFEFALQTFMAGLRDLVAESRTGAAE